MKPQYQLLCTFCTKETLESTIKKIIECYDVAFDSIYVLENTEESDALCCTYNVPVDRKKSSDVPLYTISLHRKKSYNTLYTINALNKLIEEQNDGKLDKNFIINWEDIRNSILVIQYGHLRQIKTKIIEIRKISK